MKPHRIRQTLIFKSITISILCLFLANSTFQGISYAKPAHYSLATGNLGSGQKTTKDELEQFKGVIAADGTEIVYGLYNNGPIPLELIGTNGQPIERTNGKPVLIPTGKTVHMGVLWSSISDVPVRETHYTDVRIELARTLGYELDSDTGELVRNNVGDAVSEAEKQRFEITFGQYTILHEWGHEVLAGILEELVGSTEQRKAFAYQEFSKVNREVFADLFAKAGLGMISLGMFDDITTNPEAQILGLLDGLCLNPNTSPFRIEIRLLIEDLFGSWAILRYDGKGPRDLIAALEMAGFEFTVPHMRDLTFSDPHFPDTYEPDPEIRRKLQFALADAITYGPLEAMAAPGGRAGTIEAARLKLNSYYSKKHECKAAFMSIIGARDEPTPKIVDMVIGAVTHREAEIKILAIEQLIEWAKAGRLEETPLKKATRVLSIIDGTETGKARAALNKAKGFFSTKSCAGEIKSAEASLEGLDSELKKSIPDVRDRVRREFIKRNLVLLRLKAIGRNDAKQRIEAAFTEDTALAQELIKQATGKAGRGGGVLDGGIMPHRDGPETVHAYLQDTLYKCLPDIIADGKSKLTEGDVAAFRKWYETEGKQNPGADVPDDKKIDITKLAPEKIYIAPDEKLRVIRLPVKELGRNKKGKPFYAHVSFRGPYFTGKKDKDTVAVLWVACDRDELEIELSIEHEQMHYRKAWKTARAIGGEPVDMVGLARWRDGEESKRYGSYAWALRHFATDHVYAWHDIVLQCRVLLAKASGSGNKAERKLELAEERYREALEEADFPEEKIKELLTPEITMEVKKRKLISGHMESTDYKPPDIPPKQGVGVTDSGAAASKKTTVLLVEAMPGLSIPIEDALRGEGFDVTVVTNADEARAHMTSQSPPDLVLADLNVGEEVISEAAAHNIQAIAMTDKKEIGDDVIERAVLEDSGACRVITLDVLGDLSRIIEATQQLSVHSHQSPVIESILTAPDSVKRLSDAGMSRELEDALPILRRSREWRVQGAEEDALDAYGHAVLHAKTSSGLFRWEDDDQKWFRGRGDVATSMNFDRVASLRSHIYEGEIEGFFDSGEMRRLWLYIDLLHDCEKYKCRTGEEVMARHAGESAEAIEPILRKAGFSDQAVALGCSIVAGHVFATNLFNPETRDFPQAVAQSLVEAHSNFGIQPGLYLKLLTLKAFADLTAFDNAPHGFVLGSNGVGIDNAIFRFQTADRLISQPDEFRQRQEYAQSLVDAVDAAAADLDPGQELGFIVDPTIGNLGNDYPEFLAQLNAIGDRYEVGVTAIIPEKGQDTIDAVEQYLRGGKNRIVRGVIDSSSGSAYNDRFANIAERIQLVGVNVPPTGCGEIPLIPILTSSFTGDTAGLNDIPGIKVHPAGGGVVMSIVDVLPPAAGEEINTDDLHFRYRLNAALLRNA